MADGAVKIDTDIDEEGFRKSLKRMSDDLEKSGAKMHDVVQGLGQAISGILVRSIAYSTTAIIASTAIIGKWSTASADALDRVDKLSQKMNLSRKAFQEWDYIAEQNGTTMEALSMSMKTLAVQAEMDGKSFAKLGISVKNSNRELKDQETLFNDTLAALFKIENQTERLAVASKLFGRGAQELAPILNGGKKSMEELRKKAHELGGVFSDEAVKSGAEFSSSLTDLRTATTALWQNAIIPFLPKLKELVDKFTDAAKNGGELRDVFSGIANGLVKVVTVGFPAFIKVVGWMLDNMPMVIGLYGSLRLAVLALNAAMAANPILAIALLITAVLIPAVISVYKNFDLVKIKVEKAMTYVQIAIWGVVDLIYGNLMGAFAKFFGLLSKIPKVGDAFKDAAKNARELADAPQQAISGLVDKINELDAAEKNLLTTHEEVKESFKEPIVKPKPLEDAKESLFDLEKLLKDVAEGFKNSVQEGFKNAFMTLTQGFEDFGKALNEGEDGWKAFARAGVTAIAAVVDGLSYSLMGQAASSFLSKDYAAAAWGFAQAAALKVASGVLKSTAGAFAQGGIVGGASYSGDRVLARVNSGELILNEAQQGNLASVLSAAAVLASSKNSSGGFFEINIINNTGAQVEQQERDGVDGKSLDVIIGAGVEKYMTSPKGNRLMANTFNLQQKGQRIG